MAIPTISSQTPFFCSRCRCRCREYNRGEVARGPVPHFGSCEGAIWRCLVTVRFYASASPLSHSPFSPISSQLISSSHSPRLPLRRREYVWRLLRPPQSVPACRISTSSSWPALGILDRRLFGWRLVFAAAINVDEFHDADH